jgi:two-component system, cell cycle response regulator
MNEQLIEKIRQCPSLPSLPAIALQVVELAQKDHVDMAEIARVISRDAALSSRLLRTVNSSFYSRTQSISTISHALVILGLESVKTLVLGFSLVSNLSQRRPKGFKHVDYWRRSLYAATAARTIAQRLKVVQQEECFLVGLLMDIGMLVMDQVLGEQYGDVVERAKTHERLSAVERADLGVTHAEASGILAEYWRLPPLLVTPMAFHHRFTEVGDPSLRKMAEVAHLAARCADVFVEEQAAEPITAVRQVCEERYAISSGDCDGLLDEIGKRTKDIAPLFEVGLKNPSDYDVILKRANETLVELTLRTQQQSVSLQRQNVKLKEVATTDALTGLANRMTLDRFLAQAFTAAAASGGGAPLSVLMLDVDRFKSVNDRHGHQVGDQVLRVLGKLMRGAAREQDLAARYGGEELMLVLPNTARSKAAAIAESIRRAVAAKPLLCEGIALPVTVSIGVATMEAGSPFKEPSHLMRAADMAVYAAKHGGRNCVKVFAVKAPPGQSGAAA